MTPEPRRDETSSSVEVLLQPETIRERCHRILSACEAGELEHFQFRPEKLSACADYVDETIRAQYPDLEIPFHSRWRHLEPEGRNLLEQLLQNFDVTDRVDRARIAFDLVVVSVLLDAGAGSIWRYSPLSGSPPLARSEGLAIASYDLFTSGVFSSSPDNPLQADAEALMNLSENVLTRGFQVSAKNPLVGIAGRTRLLNGVGRAMFNRPDIFGTPGRIGNLFDWLLSRSTSGRQTVNGSGIATETSESQAAEPGLGPLSVVSVFDAVLRGFGDAWPSGRKVDGIALGDVWPHPHAGGVGLNAGLVPFHKLSQWLTYSLVEPLEAAGVKVTDLDRMTGLPEYRNGGLLLDSEVLLLQDRNILNAALTPGHQCIVEWRALTVALLDRLADVLRERYGRDATQLPLVRILQGGTWSAGRKIAYDRRADGVAPIVLASDGTVF